jgi:hypothetical protein
LEKLEIEETYFNIVKAINDKATTYIVLNKEKLKPFLLKSGMRQGSPLSPHIFHIVVEFVSRAIKQEKERKKDTNKKGRSQIITI